MYSCLKNCKNCIYLFIIFFNFISLKVIATQDHHHQQQEEDVEQNQQIHQQQLITTTSTTTTTTGNLQYQLTNTIGGIPTSNINTIHDINLVFTQPMLSKDNSSINQFVNNNNNSTNNSNQTSMIPLTRHPSYGSLNSNVFFYYYFIIIHHYYYQSLL